MTALVTVLLGGFLGGAPPAGQLLDEMRGTARALRTLHALLETEESGPTGSRRRLVECWLDAGSGTVRCQFRSPERPDPSLIFWAGPRGVVALHPDSGEMAQEPRALELVDALRAVLAGELLVMAFTGELGAMKLQAYQAPEVEGAESVAGATCWRLHFPGPGPARLWLGQADHLPRRLQGELPGLRRDETLRQIECNLPIAAELLRPPAPTASVFPLAVARARWARFPGQEQRWPAAGTAAPPFTATDLDGNPRSFSLPRARRTLLGFWFHQSAEVHAALAACTPLLPPDAELIALHHGSDREAVRRAVSDPRLAAQVWLAGDAPDSAFRLYRVTRCPVFFWVDQDGSILGACQGVSGLPGLLQ